MGLQPSSASEDIPVSTVISGHHHLTLLNYVTVDFVMAVAVLAMLRTSHWLIGRFQTTGDGRWVGEYNLNTTTKLVIIRTRKITKGLWHRVTYLEQCQLTLVAWTIRLKLKTQLSSILTPRCLRNWCVAMETTDVQRQTEVIIVIVDKYSLNVVLVKRPANVT